MRFKFKTSLLTIVIVAILSGLTVSGLLNTSKVLQSSGSVKAINVEVYWDNNCTQVVNAVDWGTPDPGDDVNTTVYIRNSGTASMNLSLTTSSWTPAEAANYITLSWDREGFVLNADEVTQAVLTLSVSDMISGIVDFSFNIVIEGTG